MQFLSRSRSQNRVSIFRPPDHRPAKGGALAAYILFLPLESSVRRRRLVSPLFFPPWALARLPAELPLQQNPSSHRAASRPRLRRMEIGNHDLTATAMNGYKVVVPAHPLINHWVSVLRDQATLTHSFRSAMGELGRLLAYDATRDWLPTVPREVQSPMGTAVVESVDPMEPIMIVPILRAGLVLAEFMTSIFPSTRTFHLGMARDETTLQPSVYLNKLPERFPKGCNILLVDPMLATGGTVAAAVDLLKERGAEISQIRIISAVAAPPAIKKLNERFPGICVYTGAMDQIVNEKGFIVPGLGDAGDRSYGT